MLLFLSLVYTWIGFPTKFLIYSGPTLVSILVLPSKQYIHAEPKACCKLEPLSNLIFLFGTYSKYFFPDIVPLAKNQGLLCIALWNLEYAVLSDNFKVKLKKNIYIVSSPKP